MSCSSFCRIDDSGLESLQDIRWLFETRPAVTRGCWSIRSDLLARSVMKRAG